jgi:hypothetical protein
MGKRIFRDDIEEFKTIIPTNPDRRKIIRENRILFD